ncbi:glycosyltransferase [Belliella marina]|uniref:Glycosyltransferase n=1 Tax=Belliella marina TaxID=1644146 RepID=A0ABW4VGB7_9BACT
MLISYLSIGIVYVFVICFFGGKWGKISSKSRKIHLGQKVTILVPFRNEKRNLPFIFDSIERLDSEGIEIIWIDDHSGDGSVLVIHELIHNIHSNNLHRIIDSVGIGKKEAIECGVKAASYGIVLTTDADCILPQNWIDQMLGPFADPQVQFVAGAVMNRYCETFFERFQQIEWASILMVTKISFDRQSPLMCSGANMGYRKSAFFEVNGYEGNRDVLSGDDEFLMKKIYRHYGADALVYLNNKEAMVLTEPMVSWKSLVSQRARWASKWKAHSIPHSVASFTPVLIQLFWVSSFGLPLAFGFEGLMCCIAVWGLKILGEYYSLKKVTDFYSMDLRFVDFGITSLLHPFYVLGVTLGILFGKISWKGRRADALVLR